MKHSLTFVATEAAINIGLGFIPRRVKISNLTALLASVAASGDLPFIEWDRAMATQTAAPGGLLTKKVTALASGALGGGLPAADVTALTTVLLTSALGVKPYHGGDIISSATSAYIMAAAQIPAYASDMRAKGTLGLVNGWTLQHAGNRTGKFNAGVNTTYVKAGSTLQIGGKSYLVQALTNDGDADNEVTLDAAAPSGVIDRIGFYVDLFNAPAGQVMPAGITLGEVAALNKTAGDRLLLEAWES